MIKIMHEINTSMMLLEIQLVIAVSSRKSENDDDYDV